MTTPYENFVNIALGKSLSADVTLPTADDIPVFTGIGRQVTGKTKAELGLALTADLDTDGTLAANSDTKYPSQKAVKTYADTKQAALGNVVTANTYGSSTQYPIVTVNAKGIVTGITLQTVAPATKVYTAGVSYSVGELVYHQNETWRVLVAHTGAIPFVNGNLELVGDALNVALYGTYLHVAKRLGVRDPITNIVNKTLIVTISTSSDSTIDISEAPYRVVILNRYPSYPKKVTITKTHATNIVRFFDDTYANITTTTGTTATYDIILAPGGEVELLNNDYEVMVLLRKQNTIGRFKLSDASSTLSAYQNNGWLFSGTATDPRTVTLPDANVDLGKLANLIPEYTASTAYKVGDLVKHQGHNWTVLIDHIGAIPFVNGNLELQGSVFSVIPTTATYACQQLGSTALVDKVYDITLGNRLTPSVINLGKAPRIVRIHNVSADIEVGATNISVSLSRTGADVFTDSVAVTQVGPYVVTIPAGSTLLLYNYNTYTYVCLSQLNIAGSFKLMDAATLGTTSNKGWKFSGTASGAHTFTMPAADVNLGKLTNSTVVPSGITVTASPFTYQNTTAFNGDVIISGGTVSDIEFTRDNTTFYTVGFIEGVLRLSPSDRVRVTYTVAPTMTYVPR